MKRVAKFSIAAITILLIAGILFPELMQKAKAAPPPASKPINRNPIKTMAGYEYGVLSLEFTPDGKIIVGSDGEAVKVWDTQTGKLLTSFNPHKEGVWTIAVTPDGKTVATAGCDEMKVVEPGEDYNDDMKCALALIKFWDVQTGREARTLPGHKGFWIDRGERWDDTLNRTVMERMYIGTGIQDLEFSPDGKSLVSLGKGDDIMKIWDVDSGREIKVFKDQHFIGDNEFSPDGKILAAANQQGILLMNGRTWETIIQLKDGENPIAFSPDGRMIASACGDETIKVLDITKEKPIRTFFGHSDDPYAVAFSADGKIVASGGNDKSIFLWDLETGREISRLPGHRGAVFALALSPDGKILASGGAERYVGGEFLQGSIKFWDATSFTGRAPEPAKVESTSVQELTGHEGIVQAIAFNPNGKQLVSVSMDAYTKLWDLDSGKEIFTVRGDRMGGSLESVAFSPDGKIIAVGACGVIQLLDARSGSVLVLLNKGIQTDVRSIAFHPQRRIFASANQSFGVPIWDIESGMRLAFLDEGLRDGFATYDAAFSPDGAILAAADSRSIKLWDIQSQKMLLKWQAHSPSIESIVFSPDGKLLATAGWDKVIKLWDIQTGKLVRSMTGHRGYILSLSFCPDGKTLASGSNDFTVRLWDVASGKTVKTFTEKYFIECVAFNPDGKSIAAAIYKNIKIWKL